MRYLLVLCLFTLTACAGGVVPRMVAMNGYDPATETIVDPINVWDNYQTRAHVVARVRHGERVELLGRDGDGVHIRTASGIDGWVTYWFIKEFQTP